jgi:hypothetical protein
MEIFLGIIVFVLGWACGEYYGLGRPKKFLPPQGAILNVEAISGEVFIAKYDGKLKCFQVSDQRNIGIGLYEIIMTGEGDSEHKVLRRLEV